MGCVLRGDRYGLKGCVIGGFDLGGRDVSDRLEKASVVEPVGPFECRELDGLEGTPGSAPMDHLGLEQADDGLGERIIVAVADAADGGLDAASARRSV